MYEASLLGVYWHVFPHLQELSNPILYLDIMRWCWQQDFRSRPSASYLIDVLSSDSVPQLVEAISLHGTTAITCSALCIVPIEHSSVNEVRSGHVILNVVM